MLRYKIIYHKRIALLTVLVVNGFVQSAMMSIAYKEGLKIPPPALNEIIAAANQDVRQVGTNLKLADIVHQCLLVIICRLHSLKNLGRFVSAH